MNKTKTYVIIGLLSWISAIAQAEPKTPEPFGRYLCNNANFSCLDTHATQTWVGLWPNNRERDLVMRLNRTNVALMHRNWIVVPKQLKNLSLMDISPFPNAIEDPHHDKLIVVDRRLQAFGAYNEDGDLVYWGPATVGRYWCPDIKRSCLTPVGTYRIFRRKGDSCASTKYPVGKGGTPMPYCMFFYKGYAIHGAQLPAIPSTHGCVGIYTEDAKWLNQNFIRLGEKGTEVRIAN